MTDQGIRLYKAITDIDDEIIEEAQSSITIQTKSSNKNRLSTLRIAGIIAAACIVLIAAIVLILALTGTSKSDQLIDNRVPPERDYSPISYKNLGLPEAKGTTETEDYSYGAASFDIDSFDESLLSDCCGILEGTVLQIYPKEYDVDYYDDKFGPVELYHGKSFSVVYEMVIENVWYGEDFVVGDTILVEDEYYQMDPLASLVEGRTYVIPIYEAGDEISEVEHSVHELAPGNYTRDSIYSTIDPYHPQITKTADGNYLVTTDWQTLTSDPCREVIMEDDADYFSDKYRLVYEDDFAERLLLLIRNQLGED